MNDHFVTQVENAAARIQGYVKRTPLNYSKHLSSLLDGDIYLKMECLQISGSCKSRSVFNKLLSMSTAERARGLITVSTGNNGISTATAIQRLGASGAVFLPHTVTQHKVDTIRQGGVTIHFAGEDIEEAEIAARAYAKEERATFFSPYNDLDVIYGQGTLGLEIIEQLETVGKEIDTILVPIGGGGLISGIGGYLKTLNPAIEVIGVQPANSAVLYRSIQAGKIIQMHSAATLSDATAGGVEQGSITFDLCRQYVDDYILVSEEEILHTMFLLEEVHKVRVEGAGALTVAALRQQQERFAGKTVVALCCGSNISAQEFAQLRTSAQEFARLRAGAQGFAQLRVGAQEFAQLRAGAQETNQIRMNAVYA